MKFGENLKKLRKAKKISQEELAEKVLVSRQSVSKWETGDAYPEMSNILQICKIFHCHINDLVHEDMSDIDSLDEEIKMKVVKFKEEQQKKMKGISKGIYVIAKIGKIFSFIASIITIIGILVFPFISDKIKIVKKDLIINNYTIGTLENLNESKIVKTFLESHKGLELIIYIEIILVCLLITLLLLYITFKTVEKLFDNIHNGDTPFTLENIEYIKKIAIYVIATIVFPTISGLIMQGIMSVDLDIDLGIMDLVFILIIYSIAYIFEYGYELQKDSKGVMYGKEE